jgi:hypothetical protein
LASCAVIPVVSHRSQAERLQFRTSKYHRGCMGRVQLRA